MVTEQTLRQVFGASLDQDFGERYDPPCYIFSVPRRGNHEEVLRLHLFPDEYTLEWRASHPDAVLTAKKIMELRQKSAATLLSGYEAGRPIREANADEIMRLCGQTERPLSEDLEQRLRGYHGVKQYVSFCGPFSNDDGKTWRVDGSYLEVNVVLLGGSPVPDNLAQILQQTSTLVPVSEQEAEQIIASAKARIENFYSPQ